MAGVLWAGSRVGLGGHRSHDPPVEMFQCGLETQLGRSDGVSACRLEDQVCLLW